MCLRERVVEKVWRWTEEAEGEETVDAEVEYEEEEDMVGKKIKLLIPCKWTVYLEREKEREHIKKEGKYYFSNFSELVHTRESYI